MAEKRKREESDPLSEAQEDKSSPGCSYQQEKDKESHRGGGSTASDRVPHRRRRRSGSMGLSRLVHQPHFSGSADSNSGCLYNHNELCYNPLLQSNWNTSGAETPSSIHRARGDSPILLQPTSGSLRSDPYLRFEEQRLHTACVSGLGRLVFQPCLGQRERSERSELEAAEALCLLHKELPSDATRAECFRRRGCNGYTNCSGIFSERVEEVGPQEDGSLRSGGRESIRVVERKGALEETQSKDWLQYATTKEICKRIGDRLSEVNSQRMLCSGIVPANEPSQQKALREQAVQTISSTEIRYGAPSQTRDSTPLHEAPQRILQDQHSGLRPRAPDSSRTLRPLSHRQASSTSSHGRSHMDHSLESNSGVQVPEVQTNRPRWSKSAYLSSQNLPLLCELLRWRVSLLQSEGGRVHAKEEPSKDTSSSEKYLP